MNKVCVAVFSGLGNQLFQYAAGRTLANRLGAELCFDLSGYAYQTQRPMPSKAEVRKGGSHRTYELHHFGIDVPICNKIPPYATFATKHLLYPRRGLRGKLYKKCGLKLYKAHRRLLPLTLLWQQMSYFKEPHFHYTPRWSSLKGSVYLEGYWQSPRYFKEIEQKLRKSLNLSRFESDKTKSLLKEIAHPLSTALHFRRGDNHVSGWLLPLSYYRRSLDLLRKLLQGETPQVYIFSDDVEELKPLLPEVWGADPPPHTIVSERGLSPYEELLLMSRCQHRIIANSSYAWWGAWLSEPPSKLPSHTIAPKQWFPTDQGLAAALNTRDLYPDEWILL